ncbi:unnamed protein product [Clonostachys rosea]|uniref:GED domain-containing protein n=1 Tax=Bionectria ochroleuca TaxID=29856 RepID=A0ABY6UHQ1_BIOOC|nr:unnamed protein product [Clonostachys rosea]
MAAQNDMALNSNSLFGDHLVNLFDSMHKLARLKIEVPQLIVVGAQGSGKSSLLEALIRFHFPVDNIKPTTRFPIQLILRKANNERTEVQIEPGESRSDESKKNLRVLAQKLSGETFDNVLRKAKVDLIGVSDSKNGITGNFQDDVLVIEQHGPSLPNLNLVDLPGLFAAATEVQTLEDKDMINLMVSSYIKSPRNIVLLVISAEVNDYANVPALGMMQEMLKEDIALGSRVLCVITRPDQAASLESTLALLGKESPFPELSARPWHVVRNQDQGERNSQQSLDKRDLAEADFFNQKSWAKVLPNQKGILTLRESLKSMMSSHIKRQLPDVILEIEGRIMAAQAQLDSTNRTKATPMGRRRYLGGIAEHFSRVTRDAVNGTYKNERCRKSHDFGQECQVCKGFFAPFGSNSLESQQKRLRSNVRALNKAFAGAMRRFGKTKIEKPWVPQDEEKEAHSLPHSTEKYYRYAEPESQTREEYEKWVHVNMERWTSEGPGGEPSDGAYAGLFAYQAEKWHMIAENHVKAVWQVVEEFVELALAFACPDRDCLAELQCKFIEPNLKQLRLDADSTLRSLADCHKRPNPGFYDSFLDARAIREHSQALFQRLGRTNLEPKDPVEATGASDPPAADQGNPHRQGEPRPKSQQTNSNPQRNGGPKPKDSSHNLQQEALDMVLETAINALASNIPSLNNALVRRAVVPALIKQTKSLITNGEPSGKTKSRNIEGNVQKVVDDMFPSSLGDVAAARVIEQVEMHYEGIRASFTAYVNSLVVEQKIMDDLHSRILTQTLVQDTTDEEIEVIAGERPEHAKKRKQIENDLQTMREVLQTLNDYRFRYH